MEVAPYSPIARANASTVPDAIPGPAAGMTTRQKIRLSLIPRVWPAWIRFISTCSKAARALRYISGNATTTEAKMALYQFMTSFTPKCCMKKMPSGRFAPKSSSRK